MEQKKILWILSATSGFIVLILGFALIRFMPSTSKGPKLQQAMAITPATLAKPTSKTDAPLAEKNTVDPDNWVRDPENTPGLNSHIVPAAGNINLTIVNGDNASARYGTIDVSGLTQNDTTKPSLSTKQNLDIPGKTESGIQETTVTKTQTSKEDIAPTKKTETTIAKPAVAPVAESVKKVQPKTTLVTEYWIQTGSFTSKLNAEKARKSLTDRALTAEIFTKDVAKTTTYRVRVGPYASKTEATYWLGTIKETPSLATSYISEVKTKK